MSEEEMDISAGAGDSWTNETIFEFLRIYEKHRPLLSTYRPSNVFEIIAKDLAESCNFHIEVKPLRKKLYNLIRTFKTTKAPEKYPYHAVLKEILESKPSAEPCSLEDSYYEEMDTNLIENKNWDPAETSHMLNLLKKNHQKFKKDSKKAFYQFLAYKLSQDGYQLRSVENIARKMVNLHRSYRSSISKKKVKHANKFLFLDDMKEIQGLFNKSEFLDQELSDDSDDSADELIKQSKLEIKMESKVKRIWTEDETAAFIKILKEQTSCLPNKWQLVSQKLGQHKFYRTPGETCRKFCNLKRTFKLCLKKFEETHEKPLKFPFFDDVKVLIESELIEVEYLKGDPDFSNAVSKEEIITVQETEIEKLCCKFCLRNSGMIRLIDPVDDSDMLQKVHYLFDEQNYDQHKTNSICDQCEYNVLNFYDFKKQFEKATGFVPDQPTEIQILDDIEILDPDSEVEEIIEYEVSAADFKAYSSQQLYYADTSTNSINKKRKIS